jgi:hypothetical protein
MENTSKLTELNVMDLSLELAVSNAMRVLDQKRIEKLKAKLQFTEELLEIAVEENENLREELAATQKDMWDITVKVIQ